MEQNLDIKWYKTIDSTNTQAVKEQDTSREGTVWIADFQTHGRGQRGNSWESGRGQNLTFTVLFKPLFLSPSRQFSISEISALAVCNYLEAKGLDAKIKWPNDIYVGDRKICGMLIEHAISGDKLSASISGIGINLNQTVFNSDAPNPTSLLLETGAETEYDRKTELVQFLEILFSLYQDLKDGCLQEIHEEYMEKLYRFNEFHRFIRIAPDAPVNMPVEKISQGTEITARIVDVLENGCVVLEDENGKRQDYTFKGIRYVI